MPEVKVGDKILVLGYMDGKVIELVNAEMHKDGNISKGNIYRCDVEGQEVMLPRFMFELRTGE